MGDCHDNEDGRDDAEIRSLHKEIKRLDLHLKKAEGAKDEFQARALQVQLGVLRGELRARGGVVPRSLKIKDREKAERKQNKKEQRERDKERRRRDKHRHDRHTEHADSEEEETAEELETAASTHLDRVRAMIMEAQSSRDPRKRNTRHAAQQLDKSQGTKSHKGDSHTKPSKGPKGERESSRAERKENQHSGVIVKDTQMINESVKASNEKLREEKDNPINEAHRNVVKKTGGGTDLKKKDMPPVSKHEQMVKSLQVAQNLVENATEEKDRRKKESKEGITEKAMYADGSDGAGDSDMPGFQSLTDTQRIFGFKATTIEASIPVPGQETKKKAPPTPLEIRHARMIFPTRHAELQARQGGAGDVPPTKKRPKQKDTEGDSKIAHPMDNSVIKHTMGMIQNLQTQAGDRLSKQQRTWDLHHTGSLEESLTSPDLGSHGSPEEHPKECEDGTPDVASAGLDSTAPVPSPNSPCSSSTSKGLSSRQLARQKKMFAAEEDKARRRLAFAKKTEQGASKKEIDENKARRKAIEDKIAWQEEERRQEKEIKEKKAEEREKLKIELQGKVDELQLRYEVFEKEQARTWGAQRDRTQEIEMERELSSWKSELLRVLGTKGPRTPSEAEMREEEEALRRLELQQQYIANPPVEEAATPDRHVPEDGELLDVGGGIPEEYRDLDWKNMPSDERTQKIGELDKIRDSSRDLCLKVQHSFSEQRRKMEEQLKADRKKKATIRSNIENTKEKVKLSKEAELAAQEVYDQVRTTLDGWCKKRDLSAAAVERHTKADKSTGGMANVGKKQPDLVAKQKHEASLHGEVKRIEHEIRVARDKESELRFEVSRCRRFAKLSPEPGVAHLKTATEAYAAQQEVVTEAIQRLSKAEEMVMELWTVPAEEMGKDLLRANSDLHTARREVSVLTKQVRIEEKKWHNRTDEVEKAQMELEGLTVGSETARMTAQVNRDKLQKELNQGEAKVKAARILERDIDRLVKFAEQQEEVYQKWRTRKERSTEKSSSISPSRSRSQMDSTEQKADLVLPRIGAASSMA